MIRTLYGKLSAVLLLLLLVVGLVGVVVTWTSTRGYLEEVDQKLHRESAQHMVDENPLFAQGEVSRESLEHLFHMLMVINPRIEVYLLATDGEILGYEAPAGKVRLDRVPLPPIESFLAGDRLPIRNVDPREPGKMTIFSAAPIYAEEGGGLQGYLYVVLAGEQLAGVAERLQGSYILRLAAWSLAASVAVALLAGLALFRRLTRRLRRLDSRMQSFTASSAQERGGAAEAPSVAADPASDEIERLDRSFAAMSERISAQIDGLEQVDRLRRELVANVSHDLRTPLASLQGYLETLLLKDDALPPEERRHYLEVASRQSERLGKLVEELFELAKLDAGDTQLELEPFSMAELVQDVAQKLALGAEKRSVSLTTELDRQVPPVHADLRLIERVLVNLVDNALRHTDEGGEVKLRVAETGGKVAVEVADTGSGIPPEELPYIFDRFFRGRNGKVNGHDDRGGAGLGLAISQRVLELHGAELAVESEVGTGSRFAFTLSGKGPSGSGAQAH